MSNIYNMADTWNAAGTVFTAIKMDISNGAAGAPVSAAGSKLIDILLNGVSKFSVDKGCKTLLTNGVDTLTIDPQGTYNTRITTNYGLDFQAGDGANIGISGPGTAVAVTCGYPNGSNLSRKGWWFGRHASMTGTGPFTTDPYHIKVEQHANDEVCGALEFTGQSAWATATTQLVGGAVNIIAGNGASGSAGAAIGGDITLTGGIGYGTGRRGVVKITSIPTASAGLPSGAIWANANVLTIVP